MKIYKIFVLFVFCGVNFFNHEVLAVQAQCKEVFIEDLREENLRMTSALHILESVLSKNQKSTEVEVEHWFRSLQIAQRQGTPIKIIEHTAIVFLLKKNFVKDETLLQDMKESLRQSWFNFTGKTPAEVMSRLPKSLLKDATRDEVLFHQAVYHEGPLGFLNAMKMLANDYIFKPKDAIYALLLGSALFSNAGAEVLAAAMEGYAVASFAEYLMHRYAAHASKKSIEFLNSWAWLKKQVQEVAFSHSVVHHGSYGGSYVERFAPKNGASENAELKRLEKKAQIDELIRRQEQDVVNRIARSEYGTKLTSPWIDTVLSAPLSVTVALLTKYAANSFGIELDPGYY